LREQNVPALEHNGLASKKIFQTLVDSAAEKALISHGLIPHRWASPYLDHLIVQSEISKQEISMLW